MADLQTKKRSRTGFVIFINKVKKQVETLLSDESVDIDKLETLQITLEEKLKLVIQLTEEIGVLLTEDEEFQQDFAKYMDFELEIRTLINIIGKKVSSERKTEHISETSSTSKKSSQAQNFTKLPQIQIKKFNGDPLNWNTFIETFNAAVDNNENLSDVQKMT